MQTYSVSEIAAALGTDQVTVRRWIAKGDLPGTLDTRKGGYRVAEADLEAFLESRPKYARLAANSGLLGRKASMMVGNCAAESSADEDEDEGEGLSVYDAALIWASNGKDEDYTFGYSEDELDDALS